jgi:hypothetical protein
VPPEILPVDTSGIELPDFMASEVYTVMVFETMTGNYVTDLPVSYLNYTHTLSGPGACEVHWPVYDNKGSIDPDALQKLTSDDLEEYAYSLVITKDDTVVWGGFLGRIRASSLDMRVGCAGVGFWDYFRNRFVHPTFTRASATDVLTIVRDLVDAAQAQPSYDIGVVTGSETAGVTTTLDVPWYDFKFYGDVIEDLARSEEHRFDFRIDTQFDANGVLEKRFHVGYPQLGTRRSFVAEVGTNISVWHWERDGSDRPTRIWGIGAGEGASIVNVVMSDSTTLGRVPVRDKAFTRKDISTSKKYQLVGLVGAELHKHSLPTEVLSLTLYGPNIVGAFTVGDSIQVVIKEGFLQFDRWMRILSYTVRVQDNGQETIDVELAPEGVTGSV